MSNIATRIRHWATDWNPYDPKKLRAMGEGLEPVILEESAVHRTTVRIVAISFCADRKSVV